MREAAFWRWVMRHRRWFRWPLMVAGMLLIAVMAPFIGLEWIMARVVDPPFTWALDWLKAFLYWSRLPDDDPNLARFLAGVDRREARKLAQKLSK